MSIPSLFDLFAFCTQRLNQEELEELEFQRTKYLSKKKKKERRHRATLAFKKELEGVFRALPRDSKATVSITTFNGIIHYIPELVFFR